LGTRLKSKEHPKGFWDPPDPPERFTGLGSMLSNHVLKGARQQREVFMGSDVKVMTDANKYPPAEVARGHNEVARVVYRFFLARTQGFAFPSFRPKVFAIGYDWTKSNRQACDRIKKKTEYYLRKTRPDGKMPKGFFYITHSMGSLAVRATLKKYPDLAKKCLGVVFVVPPNLGAVVFYRRFFTGSTHDDFLFNLVLGNTPWKFGTAASGIKSAFELLPTDDYAAKSQKPREWLKWKYKVIPERMRDYYRSRGYFIKPPPKSNVFPYYRITNYPTCVLHAANLSPAVRKDIQSNVKYAQYKFHGWLKDFMPEKYCVVSSSNIETDVTTDLTAIFEARSGVGNRVVTTAIVKGKAGRNKDGDGTVPITSQQGYQSKGIRNKEFKGVNHTFAIKDADVCYEIYQMLEAMWAKTVTK